MPFWRVQVGLQDISGLPRDQYVNTYHVAAPAAIDPLGSDGDGLYNAFVTFYNTLHGYYSSAISNTTGAMTFRMYEHGLPLESPPVRSTPWTLLDQGDRTSKSPYPNEVAACMTFHGAAQAPPVFPQSWRGRVFLGPLNASAAQATGPAAGRPLAGFCTDVTDAAVALDASIRTHGYQWVIYSRKQSMLYPVHTVGCDDAWDTQRSRGLRATNSGKVGMSHTVFPDPSPA